MVAREDLDPEDSLWAWMAVDLHYWRSIKGLSLAEVGKILLMTRASVSNLEAGRRGYRLDQAQARALDELWGLNRHFELLLHYAKAGHDPDWIRQYVTYESRASVIKTWELAWVPGLLQTEEYARASLMAGGARDVESLVEARMARKELMSRKDAPIIWILIWEPALEACVGGPKVMRSQLAALLEASESPDVNLRVVPRGSGSHLGLDGAFKLLTLTAGDVSFVEAPGGGRLVSSPAEVGSYALRYDRIGQEALPVGPSRDLMTRIMEGL